MHMVAHVKRQDESPLWMVAHMKRSEKGILRIGPHIVT